LSDDDQIEPGFVSSMVAAFEDSQVHVAVSRQTAIDENGRPLRPVKDVTEFQTSIIQGADYVWAMFRRPHSLPIITYVSLFARRRDFLDLGFRNYPDGSHADNILMVQLAFQGKVALVASLLKYRIYSTSFGLSTSLPNLIQASLSYENDIRMQVALHRTSLGLTKAALIPWLVKLNNVRMLVTRLFVVYRKRYSAGGLLGAGWQVVLYCLGRSSAIE